MKILNLYAGIGGNRKLWGDEHEITAVEINKDIANIYNDFFSNDKIVNLELEDFENDPDNYMVQISSGLWRL